ncbi:sirohydrochlorin chelatase [Simplicispira psychrophila]|uniref:sirohydrochlorin chelatase n=1 Tax=Simplicispira psychrophila TaxID=80882 RepID=UPI0006909B9A|nr:CbiX/SirB N-terminal domain-containing protein [Simplicispira psychrophila]
MKTQQAPHDNSHGIVLFAHGSRDPLWRAPIEAVRQQLETQHQHTAVRCSYLELCAPSLPDAVQELTTQGATRITVVPMFLGTGKHAREDLPVLVQALRNTHPGVQFHVQPAIGEDPRMTALMAEIACSRST